MLINLSVLLYVIIFFLSLLFLIYIYPFIRPIWLKPTSVFNGYIIGKSCRKKVNIYIQNSMPNDKKREQEEIQKQVEDTVEKITSQELSSVEAFHKIYKNNVEQNIKKVEKKKIDLKKTKEHWEKQHSEKTIPKIVESSERHMSEIKMKNFVLLFLLLTIIIIDSLIAKHIFQSLGFFPEDTIEILGRTLPNIYPILYGSFFTFVLAIFLHFTLPFETMRDFFHNRAWGKRISIIIVLTFLLLMFFAVIFPDISNELIEFTMRTSWALGVFGVYWLGELLIGTEKNYSQLILPITLLFLVLGWVVFGAFKFIEVFIFRFAEFFISTISDFQLERLSRKKDNENINYVATKQGFFRGF